jgi:hypothetical protein
VPHQGILQCSWSLLCTHWPEREAAAARCLAQAASWRLEPEPEGARLARLVAEQQAALASQAQQLQALRVQLAAQPLQASSSPGPGAGAGPAVREEALVAREAELAGIQAQLRGEAERLARARDALARDRAQLQVRHGLLGCVLLGCC